MPSFAGLGKFFGRTASEGAAFAAGLAISPALSPVVREVANEANAKYSSHPLSSGEAAAIVAEDVERYDFGKAEASFNGLNEDRFKALLGEVLNAPGVGELYEAYRRDLIDDAAFEHGLRKAKLETMWDAPLKALKDVRLSAQDVAVMVQRGILPNPNWLPVGPPTETGRVPPMPQESIDPVAEARSQGFDEERARALAKIIGLPASPDLAARMTFREIIERVDFDRAISEGNTRNEWAPFLFEGFREILTSNQYTELELRGFSTRDQRLADTGKHGMSQDDSDKLFDVLGRAPAVHAVTTGLARGGKYPGNYANVPEPYKSAIQRSNIREEWSEIVYANRYTYPSGFQIKAEVKAGDMTAAEGEAILLEIGWSPKWAKFFSEKWAGAAPTTGAVSTASETAKAIRSIGSSYSATNITLQQAQSDLAQFGLPADELTTLFDAWAARREAKLQSLSNAQIRNRYRTRAITLDEALARLEAHGLTATDAQIYLAGDLTQLTDDQIREQYKAGLVTLAAALAVLESRGMTPIDAETYLAA